MMTKVKVTENERSPSFRCLTIDVRDSQTIGKYFRKHLLRHTNNQKFVNQHSKVRKRQLNRVKITYEGRSVYKMSTPGAHALMEHSEYNEQSEPESVKVSESLVPGQSP
jgi:hypothetical protein